MAARENSDLFSYLLRSEEEKEVGLKGIEAIKLSNIGKNAIITAMTVKNSKNMHFRHDIQLNNMCIIHGFPPSYCVILILMPCSIPCIAETPYRNAPALPSSEIFSCFGDITPIIFADFILE